MRAPREAKPSGRSAQRSKRAIPARRKPRGRGRERASAFQARASRAQEALHSGRLAEDEARHEPEDWVVDFAALGDGEARAAVLRLDLEGPGAAERLIGIGDPA